MGNDLTKEEFKNRLKIFFSRAQKAKLQNSTSGINTKDIADKTTTYKNMSLKVSFGQGMINKRSWMTFLQTPFTTSKGVYPYIAADLENQTIISYIGFSDREKVDLSESVIASINALNQNKFLYPTISFDAITDDVLNQLIEFIDNLIDQFQKIDFELPASQTYQKKDTRTQSLNQILYGPPGTGKTYHTINKALEIIDGIVPSEREDAKKRFDALVQAKQIEFVTFHQSYGYEEFVEGIKAIPVGEEGNEDGSEMIYKPMAGIFKKLAIIAKSNYELSKQSALTKDAKFDILWKKLKDFLTNEIDEKEKYFLTEQVYIFEVQDQRLKYKGDNWLRHDQGLNLKYKNIKAMYIAGIKERKAIKDIDNVESLAKQHATYNLAILDKIYELEKSINFVQETQERKNHILIIDEINRGNISKIFGELITLIEPSKRIGAEEAISVKLPYSSENFGIPSNLYIIGTMNTADRSIALMDTALRRRFEFTEMMPDLSVLEGIDVEGINIAMLLETMNKRIEYLYDRDHTIGHAYFIGLKERTTREALERIFRYKIIPLLQEYFYDDWEKIMLVLGEGFIEKTPFNVSIFDKEMIQKSDYIEDEKYLYTIKKTFDFSKFVR